MGLEVKHFLWVNGVLVGLIALSIWVKRKGTATPSRLNMRAGNPPPKSGKEGLVVKNQSFAKTGFASRPGGFGRAKTGNDRSKNLNVIFNYNGHSWDAYEALGVPAGSSKAAVEKAYQEVLKTVDPESRNFIETAYRAIMQN